VEQTLLISTVLLWIAVVVLAGIVISLARQIGLLHQRIAPAGALMIGEGNLVNKPSPVFELETLAGQNLRIGGGSESGKRQLIYFLSPTCPICASLIPVIQSLQTKDAKLTVVLASDGPREEHEEYTRKKGSTLSGFPYVLSQELGMTFGVAKLPYAVLIDAEGIVRAHGMVNSREHLESLLEAEERGVASIQDYMNKAEAKQAAGHN
jgi:methylamine dehydrogenase accessory protein MauD